MRIPHSVQFVAPLAVQQPGTGMQVTCRVISLRTIQQELSRQELLSNQLTYSHLRRWASSTRAPSGPTTPNSPQLIQRESGCYEGSELGHDTVSNGHTGRRVIGTLPVMTSELAGAVVALVLALSVSAITGQGERGERPIGDRIMLGALSLPLWPLVVHFVLPDVTWFFKLWAGAPLLFYLGLLANEDWDHQFTRRLVYGLGAIYLVAGVVFAVGSP